ncbi:MAG: O-linked GlcNAc transferase-like protein [Lachnospiraceae bacterium]|nr:O-linked GlcNAc transferase-like protein [Lachnospiraceae bacterium]
MKAEKGQYGYRDSSRKMRLAVTAALALAVLAQVCWRFFVDSQAAKNILTVMAILTVLPMANMAAPLLASWRYRTPSREFYQKLCPYEEKCVILYDLVITTKEYVLPMDAIAIHPQGIYGFCTAKKLDKAKAEKSLNALFAANKLDSHVKVIQEEGSFFCRLDSLKPMEGWEDDGSVEYGAGLLKSLSM